MTGARNNCCSRRRCGHGTTTHGRADRDAHAGRPGAGAPQGPRRVCST
jgi:hypothetical protein